MAIQEINSHIDSEDGPLTLDLSVEDDGWLSALPDLFGPPTGDPVEPSAGALLRLAVAKALALANIESRGRAANALLPTSVAILLATDMRVAQLNGTFRNKPQPTNILSFPNQDFGDAITDEARFDEQAACEPIHLGDLALARETVFREAREQGKSTVDHVIHLVVHGILHLLDYDHADEHSALKMEALERRILAEIGIENPYEGEPQGDKPDLTTPSLPPIVR